MKQTSTESGFDFDTNDLAKLLGGAAAGALLMYMLDPDRGSARRSMSTAAIRNAEAAIYGALTPSVYYYPVSVGGNVGVPVSAPSSPTVAPPFTPNTVYMVRSNKVQLIRGKNGMPLP